MFHPLDIVRKTPHARHIIVAGMFLSVAVFFGHHSHAVTTPALKKESARIRFTTVYRIGSEGKTSRLKLTALIPQTMPERQEVLSLDYSKTPSKVYTCNGNRYAEFDLRDPKDGDEIAITATMALYKCGIEQAKTAVVEDEVPSASYLLPEPGIDLNVPVLADAARNLPAGDDVERLRSIYSFVSGKMTYRGYVSEDVGAARALEKAYGDCSDFTDVFVSLCRASGIPARSVDGYLINYGNDTPRHTWAEAYIRRYGWVPVDPLLTYLRKVHFDGLPPQYIYLSRVRNDPVINNYHFYSCSYSGGPLAVTDHYAVERLPEVALKVPAVKE